MAESPADAGEAGAAPLPLLEFAAAAGSGPGALPSLRHAHAPARHYAFEPRPLLPQRALTIAWRRLRRAQRSGPRTELDIGATVDERCRNGFVVEPVLVAARRNQVRLVVLVDASASMQPWRSMNRLLAASLDAGQLARARLLFFDNDPRDGLFDTDTRTGRNALETVLRDEAGAVAIVVGDAGAARGRTDRDRIAGTHDFLRASRSAWPRLAWLNPMPQRRWAGTSAARTALDPACAMFEWGDDGLARAVERLRA